MSLSTGTTMPNVKVKLVVGEDAKDIETGNFFAGRKTVLFGVPGAFTPTCSQKHLPGFAEMASEIKGKGVDEIICMSVNDFFVMQAWGQDQAVDTRVSLLADGSGELSKALGIELDLTSFGMGMRCERFSAIVDDGKFTTVNFEEGNAFEKTNAETILGQL